MLILGSLKSRGATYQRIEDKYSSGIPDINVCHGSNECWVEAKFCKKPAREGTPIRVSFRPHQLPWMRERMKKGGKCFVIIRVGRESFLMGEPSIESGHFDMPLAKLRKVALAYGRTDPVIAVMLDRIKTTEAYKGATHGRVR